MYISKKVLDEAVSQDIISAEQSKKLIDLMQGQTTNGPLFDFTHILYYFGGLVAIAAMSIFMAIGWESFGGLGITILSVCYAAVGIKLINSFSSKGYQIPAGICGAFVIALTPLTIYGLQNALGLWPDASVYEEYHRLIKWQWIYMELGTLIVGIIIAWKYKYPFLMMPVAITLWYLTMDLTSWLGGGYYDWQFRAVVSMYSGLLMIALGFWIDLRSRGKADYAFWIYLFAVIAFWGGLSSQHSNSELTRFFYLIINLLMILAGAIIKRRVFVIFGSIGSFGYLGHLADDLFHDSWLFPITLSALGLGIIYLGILWQRHEKTISDKVIRKLPVQLREFLASK